MHAPTEFCAIRAIYGKAIMFYTFVRWWSMSSTIGMPLCYFVLTAHAAHSNLTSRFWTKQMVTQTPIYNML